MLEIVIFEEFVDLCLSFVKYFVKFGFRTRYDSF